MNNAVANNSSLENWHPADIKASLTKKGYSLSKIARENGYAETSPSNVFYRPWAAMEKIIAKIIGVPPQEIWPNRYTKKGSPYRTARVSRVHGGRNG